MGVFTSFLFANISLYLISSPTPIRVGRNSYGGQWGEGAGGGWFRLERGVNALSMESHECNWAVPAQADVQRALGQWRDSVAQ
jgi:hypothetical protein